MDERKISRNSSLGYCRGSVASARKRLGRLIQTASSVPRFTTLTAISIALAFGSRSDGAQIGVFQLELPELKIQVNENVTADIPSSFVNHIAIRVLRSSQEMPTGQIVVRINGEPANIIMSTRAAESTILCDLDLNFRPGFLLHAGQNAIEASAKSVYGRPYYAIFILNVRDEPKTLREIQREAVVSKQGDSPPEIHLVDPQGAVENVRELTVNGYVRGGIAPVQVTVQGEAIALKSGPDRAGARKIEVVGVDGSAYTFTAPVALSLKQESIEIIATDAHNNRSRVLIPVIQGSRVPIQRWAIVIGVSHYQNSQINLQYADRDAESMRDFLEDPKGGAVPPTNVFYAVNEQATAGNIRSALFEFLDKPGPDDLVIVYFAGHGANDPESPDNYYLLGYDADPQNLGATAVRMRELQESFGNYLKANLVTLVDACHSGGIGKSLQNMTNARWANAGFGSHRAIITASDVSEFSREDASWGGGHGVFTFYVLQGLKGAADADHDHQVSVGELFDYVSRHVADETHGAQNPQALARSERGFVLASQGSKRAEFFSGHLDSLGR